jgi:hypothetical protein
MQAVIPEPQPKINAVSWLGKIAFNFSLDKNTRFEQGQYR